MLFHIFPGNLNFVGQNAHCAEVPSSNFKDYFFGELSLNRDSAGEGVAKVIYMYLRSDV